MKKKILFMLINMNIGGTEKSLLSILAELEEKKYDITLLMLEEYGELLNQIPSWVNIKYIDNFKQLKRIIDKPIHITAIDLFKNKQIISSIILIYLYLIYKLTKEKSKFFKYILRHNPIINDEYDVAVAYAGPMDFISYFVVNKVKAKKKIQWIHFDVTKIGFNKNFAKKIYKKFDNILVVSKEGKEKLVEKIPSMDNKIEVLNNIISSKSIKLMSKQGEGFKDKFNGIRILTVARLSKEKGQYLTIPVLARLKREGYNIIWYCIGDGISRREYEELVKQYNLENDYIFLGSQSNPYTMMKDCDIYVQPSIHEGFCITLAEARCFNAPIITTNFTGAREQIIDGKTGLISDISEKGLYINIKKILDDIDLKNNISKHLELDEPDTRNEVLKLENIINS